MANEWKNEPKTQSKNVVLLSTSYMGRNTTACILLVSGNGLEVSGFPNDARSAKDWERVRKQLQYEICG